MGIERRGQLMRSGVTEGKVYFEHILPESGNEGTVLLLHGLGDHIGRHEWAIRMLTERGFSVVAIDWPGSGKSEGIRGDLPRVTQAGPIVEEVLNQISLFPVGVLAHSTGGFLFNHLYQTGSPRFENLKWVWLSSALFRPRYGQHPAKIAAATFLAKWIPRFTLSTGVHPSDCYHVPPGEDPDHFTSGCHNRASLGFGADILSTERELRADNAPDYPDQINFLATQGSEDHICPPEFAFDFFSGVQCKSKTILLASNSRHEPFREPDPEGLLGGIRCWLDQRVAES